MTKKKNSKQSPFMAFAIIGGISFITAILADKFGGYKKQPQQNYHANVTHNQPFRQLGQPIGQISHQPQPQIQQQPNDVRTIQTSIPVTSNLQINGNPIQAQPIQTEVQQQQPYITQQPIPMQKPNNNDIGKNGYRGLISSHSMDLIRDSNKPVIASSKIVNGPPSTPIKENDDDGAYPYPSEILSPEAMVISGNNQ